MKLGTKTEKEPAARPNRNLPTATTSMTFIKVKAQPIVRRRFAPWMQFFFPNLTRGPHVREPIAAPSEQRVVMRAFHVSSESVPFF